MTPSLIIFYRSHIESKQTQIIIRIDWLLKKAWLPLTDPPMTDTL